MKQLSLAQSFSIIALNANDSHYMTTPKKVSLRCIIAAMILEVYLDNKFEKEGLNLAIEQKMFSANKFTPYQQKLFELILGKNERTEGTLKWWLKKATSANHSKLKNIETAIVKSLKDEEVIIEIPNLLGCDLFYYESGVFTEEYRSDLKQYSRAIECIRAETLEEGGIDDETIIMLWLLRESGYMHDIFSSIELEAVVVKMSDLYRNNPLANELFVVNIHRGLETVSKSLLQMKKRAVKVAVGTGINFVFPFIERSQSIFIDVEAWFSNPEERLNDVKKRLEENGHIYSVIIEGEVPLVKIDNITYHLIPTSVICNRVPVHGVRLRRCVR